MSFDIWYVKFPEYPSLPDGSELEATYAYSLSVYKFWISDIITLFPNCIGTMVLFAVLIFLLKSYFAPISAENPELLLISTLFSAIIISEIYTPDD